MKKLSFALGRSDRPLGWGRSGTGAVRLVFLMAVPATDSAQYLALISGLARLTKEHRLVEELHAAQDTFQIAAVLQQIELRTQSPPATAKVARL